MAVKISDLLKPIVAGQPVVTRGSVNITLVRTSAGIDVMVAGISYSYTGVEADTAAITTAVKALLDAQVVE